MILHSSFDSFYSNSSSDDDLPAIIPENEYFFIETESKVEIINDKFSDIFGEGKFVLVDWEEITLEELNLQPSKRERKSSKDFLIVNKEDLNPKVITGGKLKNDYFINREKNEEVESHMEDGIRENKRENKRENILNRKRKRRSSNKVDNFDHICNNNQRSKNKHKCNCEICPFSKNKNFYKNTNNLNKERKVNNLNLNGNNALPRKNKILNDKNNKSIRINIDSECRELNSQSRSHSRSKYTSEIENKKNIKNDLNNNTFTCPLNTTYHNTGSTYTNTNTSFSNNKKTVTALTENSDYNSNNFKLVETPVKLLKINYNNKNNSNFITKINSKINSNRNMTNSNIPKFKIKKLKNLSISPIKKNNEKEENFKIDLKNENNYLKHPNDYTTLAID